MKKQVSPVAFVVVIAIVVIIAAYFFWRGAQGKRLTAQDLTVGPQHLQYGP